MTHLIQGLSCVQLTMFIGDALQVTYCTRFVRLSVASLAPPTCTRYSKCDNEWAIIERDQRCPRYAVSPGTMAALFLLFTP